MEFLPQASASEFVYLEAQDVSLMFGLRRMWMPADNGYDIDTDDFEYIQDSYIDDLENVDPSEYDYLNQ